jgi:hypothetical protein
LVCFSILVDPTGISHFSIKNNKIKSGCLVQGSMSTIRKDKFLYMYTGKLDNDQISSLVRKGIDRYIKSTGKTLKERQYSFVANAVENKKWEKLGYAYGWISDLGLFHALSGKNEDGSSRVEYIDDPEYDSDEEEVDLSTLEDWGSLAASGPQKIRVEHPTLISVDSYVDEEGVTRTLDFFEANYKEKSGMKNEIYSYNVPKEISENFLRNVFQKFGTDSSVHFIKKQKKHVKYPLIEITNDGGSRDCRIEFSPLDKNLAAFVLGITKKLCYGHHKHEIILFSQKKRRYHKHDYG